MTIHRGTERVPMLRHCTEGGCKITFVEFVIPPAKPKLIRCAECAARIAHSRLRQRWRLSSPAESLNPRKIGRRKKLLQIPTTPPCVVH